MNQKQKFRTVLMGLGGAIVVLIICLLCIKPYSNKTLAFKGDYPDPVTIEIEDEDGNTLTIEAIEGQVCVWFEDGVPAKEAYKLIRDAGGKIIAQVPRCGYYLVKVPSDEVQDFLDDLYYEPAVNRVFPNMIMESCAAANYILDDFYPDTAEAAPHGVIVQFAMEECESKSPIRAFNIGNASTGAICTSNRKTIACVNTEFFALDTIDQLAHDGPIIINLSYGAVLPKRIDEKTGKSVRYYWTEADPNEQDGYRKNYKNTLINLISNLKPLLQSERDFIIVSSAGNRGVKNFYRDVISYMRRELNPEQIEVLDKHLLLVSADETERVERHRREYERYNDLVWKQRNDTDLVKKRNWEYTLYKHYGRYSNDIEEGGYDPWVTRVELSDFMYAGEEHAGTSFASPRAACMLSSVINEKNLTGYEVLELARAITRRDKMLTKEALLAAAKAKLDPLSTINIPEDIIGQVIHDPSENGYFPPEWTWTIKQGEVLGATEMHRSSVANDSAQVMAVVHLHKGELKVDVEMVLHYEIGLLGAELNNVQVHAITIPQQTNYASLVRLKPNADFIPGLMLENHSDYWLFVGGHIDLDEGVKRFMQVVEPHSEEYMTILGVPDNYHIEFAYKM